MTSEAEMQAGDDIATLKAAFAIERQLRAKHPDYGKEDGFDGYKFDPPKGKDLWDCTTFAREVLDQAGYDVSGSIGRKILIAEFDWKKETGKPDPSQDEITATLAELVEREDPRTKGVVHALVESGQGTEIAGPSFHRAGQRSLDAGAVDPEVEA